MNNNTKQKTCCNQNCDQGRKCPERKESGKIFLFLWRILVVIFFCTIGYFALDIDPDLPLWRHFVGASSIWLACYLTTKA